VHSADHLRGDLPTLGTVLRRRNKGETQEGPKLKKKKGLESCRTLDLRRASGRLEGGTGKVGEKGSASLYGPMFQSVFLKRERHKQKEKTREPLQQSGGLRSGFEEEQVFHGDGKWFKGRPRKWPGQRSNVGWRIGRSQTGG